MVSTRSSSSSTAMPPQALEPKTPRRAAAKSAASRASATAGWSHIAPTSTLVWMAISLPLIAWDAGYVLGRPATMPGGSLHWPLWTPYKLYGEVDHMYGFKQWNAGNGFTAAQTILNVIESALYLAYLWVWYKHGRPTPNGRAISGRAGATALLLGFSAAVMTLSKTLLYWLNEYYSSFDNIGHNTPFDLVLLWIIPNGAWLVLPAVMIYTMGSDIIDGLAGSSGADVKSE